MWKYHPDQFFQTEILLQAHHHLKARSRQKRHELIRMKLKIRGLQYRVTDYLSYRKQILDFID